MKKVLEVTKSLRGEPRVPGDKSIGHRAVIFGGIANGPTRILNLSGGEDNLRTLGAFKDLGVEVWRDGEALCIEGRGWDGLSAPPEAIDCGNSGTTMRLLSGVLAGRPFTARLDGDGSLRRRPMQRIIDPLTQMGAEISSESGKGLAPLKIHGGKLRSINYRLPVASAQVKSAILFAALQAEGLTVLEEPQKSRDHTELMAEAFGAELEVECRTVRVKGKQSLRGRAVVIPGDISSAAFFLVAAATVPDSHLMIHGVGCNPTRDGVIEVLQRMGANIRLHNERVESGERVADFEVRGGPLRGVEIGPEYAARTIDEYPILCVAAALADGETTLTGVKELRYKESDRIASMTEGLRRLGVAVEEREDGMRIKGRARLEGNQLRSFGDHRIAMALAVAGLSSAGGVEIDDTDCVDISFPGFFGLLDEICVR